MSAALINHLMRASDITPSPSLAEHNDRCLTNSPLLYLTLASAIEREFGSPVIWSGTRHLPWPGNPPLDHPHAFTVGPPERPMHAAAEIVDGLVVLFGHAPNADDALAAPALNLPQPDAEPPS